MAVDHYGTLEVSPRASRAVIEAAHKVLVKNGGDKKALNAAKTLLVDDDKRAAYDAELNQLEGTIIGQYRIIEKIAEGGFGITYKGEHTWLGTPVCIKHCSRISPEMDRVLEQEACAVWDLRHYAIPVMRDILRLEDGSSALVMSYIEGPTLEEIVEAKGRLHPEHVVWIMQRVLNALQYLHFHGVVHGDIKPQNVIIQPEKHMAVLVDYGLAMVKPKADDESIGYTEIYSPPEQRKGDPLIPETDLYSLGMMALYALNNNERRTRSKKLATTVPKPLRDFLMRLIARDTLSRPNWGESPGLMESFEAMRVEAFGRAHSAMRDLKWP